MRAFTNVTRCMSHGIARLPLSYQYLPASLNHATASTTCSSLPTTLTSSLRTLPLASFSSLCGGHDSCGDMRWWPSCNGGMMVRRNDSRCWNGLSTSSTSVMRYHYRTFSWLTVEKTHHEMQQDSPYTPQQLFNVVSDVDRVTVHLCT
jgi:hypothetical protein